MKFDPIRHHRHSIRLRGHDYSRVASYFVTICSHARACLFGEIVHGEMQIVEAGRIVEHVWCDLPQHYPYVSLDSFVLMPNHLHGVLLFTESKIPQDRRHGLGEVVRALKTFSALQINQARGTPGVPVWQRNYYEHIVRTEGELERIRRYILENPLRWETDPENPALHSTRSEQQRV